MWAAGDRERALKVAEEAPSQLPSTLLSVLLLRLLNRQGVYVLYAIQVQDENHVHVFLEAGFILL